MGTTTRTLYVQDFTEGDMSMKDLLGGKGANLAEMTRLGLPVPPGFTVSTLACRQLLTTGAVPGTLDAEVAAHVATLEAAVGRGFGAADDPLLLSVRSGAASSMPGMMETVLDVGLHEGCLAGLARHGGEGFALDSYRRLVEMFGTTVLGVDHDAFASARQDVEASGTDGSVGADGAGGANGASAAGRRLVDAFLDVVATHTGRPFPQDPHEQLRLAVRAVLESWNTPRARLYRRREGIAEDLGTAVNVQVMVFGNRGPESGSGVCFTRDPATGAPGLYADYLPDAQGEDVVAGIRNTLDLDALAAASPAAHTELVRVAGLLETHYRDMCDLEFTVEDGRLWMLQTRVGKRTPAAAVRIAHDLATEGLIDLDEALRRVSATQLAGLLVPSLDHAALPAPLTRGTPASPGAAVGRVALDSEVAARMAGQGDAVVLVREETTPDDLPGMVAAQGILTARGGRTSHAAVVARGMGRPCVCGAEDLEIDLDGRRLVVGGTTLAEGDVVSLEGGTGHVYPGAVPVTDAALLRRLDGDEVHDPVTDAAVRLLAHADQVRRLDVRANADTAADAEHARRLGAHGVGLCRTEHQFLGSRRVLVERLVLAADAVARDAVLAEMLALQRADFHGVLAAMDGLPVTVRLLDPPLHEFLPDIVELTLAVERAAPGPQRDHQEELLHAVHALHEQNPMMGLRGVRLAICVPGLYETQVRALVEAACDLRDQGGDPRPEVMIPLVTGVPELALVRSRVEAVVAEVLLARGGDLPVPVGTMIEVPRAALTSDEVAEQADFFSFGTNDLTQLTWAYSRDDAETSFVPAYLEQGLLATSPFETIDVAGVGALVRTAAELGRARHPRLGLGVCGEHGGDPRSIHFFEEVGLDYVSCSPFRVPVARWEAGRARLLALDLAQPVTPAGAAPAQA